MSYLNSTKYARKSDSQFVVGAARAIYVTAWADKEEKLNRGNFAGCEITEIAPETQRWAFVHARELAMLICQQLKNNFKYDSMPSIIDEWQKESMSFHGLAVDPVEINYGWYAAMSAMGHGVGLADMGVDMRVPYMSCDR